MKVLIAVHYFPPHVGGIEVVAENQAKFLVKHGNEVSVLTSAINFKKGLQTHKDKYRVYRVPAWNYFEQKMGVPFPIYSIKLVTQAYKLVRQADVVHVHDAFYLSSFITAFWAWLFGKPLFLTQHVAKIPHNKKIVGYIQDLVYRTSGFFIFHKSARIIIYNGRVKKFLLNRRIDENKIITVTNGTNLELFHPVTHVEQRVIRKKYNLPLDKTLALFVGRFVPKKGFDKLLRAASDDYIIVFAGGPPLKDYERDARYKFVGALSQSQLADIYKACDIFVLPSEGEGFPLSIQEAMASGLPIVTTDDEGYAILNLDRKLFRLINPTVKRISSELLKLTSDRVLRENMGAYSRNYASNHFNWDSMIEELTQQYRQSVS